MTDDDTPTGLSEGGRHLWLSLLTYDETLADDMNPARNVALEACRTKDRCDILAAICTSVDVVVDNGKGQVGTHPALVSHVNSRTR